MVGNTSTIRDSDGWNWKIRNNKQDTIHPIRNPFQKDIEKIATSFFVTNFTEHVDAKRLWQVCQSYGRIVDAFIANKRSKAGKRFGFVRFIGVKNEEAFAKSLANIWIGSFHLFASVARFQRRERTEAKCTEGKEKVAGHIPTKHVGKAVEGSSQNNQSYASILHGGGGSKLDRHDMPIKRITLTDHELVQVTNSLEVALVKVKSAETMSSLYRICCEEGFDRVKIHRIGGLWLWIHFQSVESCNAFKSNTNLKSFFTTIKPVSKNFYVDERMVWVEISGLPLCAWGSNAFKKVASSVGRFMFFENDNTAAMSLGIDDSSSHTSETDSKVGDDVANEEEFESEEDMDEEKRDDVVEDKNEIEHREESIHSNTGNENNGEKETIIEKEKEEEAGNENKGEKETNIEKEKEEEAGSDLSRPPERKTLGVFHLFMKCLGLLRLEKNWAMM
ncbi:hypothetical protein CTI12_AA069040 [Artemisia annua]|uniref:RRM domain-containing protein n=1 Tax=Artemisia annua TaxID=35608 RepID=A0A2U1Q6I0_ARTAN|nr:hypothetical protein CTI12_AA069040 [Artemisia annua]